MVDENELPLEFWNVIQGLLRDEAQAAEQYCALQKAERENFRTLNTGALNASVAQRETLLHKIKELECKRSEVLRKVGFSGREKISILVKSLAPKTIQKQLLQDTERIRIALTNNRIFAEEQAGLLDFVEKMTGGLIGLFRSATTGVFRSYTRRGKIFDAYHEPLNKPTRQL